MKLATYACHPEESKGRLNQDFLQNLRSPFQRDRDRIIHSSAFRKLDSKTQVFAYHEGKNFRTRLTHSIEVAQITRTICKNLNLNEELGEAIALAHDIGHAPFGHAGERGLEVSMKDYGGFDHNINSLKIMTKLEIHYPEFEGLNLTWETLEGTIKHNGPIKKSKNKYLKEFNKTFDLKLNTFPSLEAQVGAVADDITYNNHDIDDGFRAGFFSIDDLKALPFLTKIITDFDNKYPQADDNLKIYNVTRNLIAVMVFDILSNAKENLKRLNILTSDDARNAKELTIDFSKDMSAKIKLLRIFLKENFYTHTNIARMDTKSQRIIQDLFSIFMDNYLLLPIEQRKKITNTNDKQNKADIICEYIAGMTDMNAIEEHNNLFNIHKRF